MRSDRILARTAAAAAVFALAATLVAGLAAREAAPEQEPGGGAAAAAGPRPIHADPEAAEEALVRAVRAFLHDDRGGAAEALDMLARTTRVAFSDEADDYGSMVGYSRSFELTTNLAREYLAADRPEDAYEQFVWLQKACRSCHVYARERNLISSSSRAGSGSPSRSSAATPSR